MPKQTESQILIGTPKPANMILGRVFVNPEDAEAVKAIPLGFAQETPLEKNKAVAIIGAMERKGLIPKRAFRVRLFREGDKRKVAIVHEENGEQASGTISTKAKLPTPEDVADFIESQEAYHHDVSLIAQHFLSHDVDSHTDSTLYFRMRQLAIDARKIVESRRSGKFVMEKAGHRKIYSWSKQ